MGLMRFFWSERKGYSNRVPVVPPRRIDRGHPEELELDHLAHGRELTTGGRGGTSCGTRYGDNSPSAGGWTRGSPARGIACRSSGYRMQEGRTVNKINPFRPRKR